MASRWQRLAYVVALSAGTLTGRAQAPATYSRPVVPIPDPVYVLNSTVIINGLMGEVNSKEIKSIQVYKGAGSPGAQDVAPQLRNLGPAGVINIVAPRRVRGKSFTQLGHQLGLRGPLTFALNGYALDASTVATLRIAPAAIAQLHIVQPTPELSTTRVDIWLALPRPTLHPPGTVMIR